MAVEQYDAIVIGAGQSGGPLTSALTANGLRTALIERSKVGGTCVNWGCTPTKTMIASADVAHAVDRARDYGVNVDSYGVELSVVRGRKRDVVDMFHDGSRGALESTDGLDILMGEATFTGPKTVTVALNQGGTRELTAEKIFINTGTETAIPPVDGIEDVPYLTSTSIMELDEVPEHLIVVGGGYIGLEFAQMFRRFGAAVSIVQRGPQLLRSEDPDIADEVYKVLVNEGIGVHLNASLESVSGSASGEVSARVIGENGEFHLPGSHILIATGRRPSTRALSPENAGIEVDERGFVPVNGRLETNVPGVWAMGDVNGGAAFTHISYDDYRILTNNLFGDGNATADGRVVPWVVFIDPELARVGMNEKEAMEAGLTVRTASMPMEGVARAIESDKTEGVMKAVIDAESDRILGATVFGMRGGEVMSILQLAIITRTPYTVLRDAPFAHPTVAESLNNLFSSVE